LIVSHALGERRVSKDVNEETGFLLTNKKGGFFNLGISSRYRGLFFRFKDDALKVIDEIRVRGEITELRNNFWNIARYRGKFCESFFMPMSTDCLVYELSSEQEIEFLFDVKKAYDNREWGRNYKVWLEGGMGIIEFTKTTDRREDSSSGTKEFTVYLAIDCGNKGIAFPNQWEKQEYSFDRERNSYPAERHVYKGLIAKSKRAVIGFSESKEEAVRICNNVKKHLERFKQLQKRYTKVSIRNVKNEKINLAAKCAIESLDNLIVANDENDSVNIYAGLPWFFQFWSRDLFVSLKALMMDKEYNTVKKILMEYLHCFGEDGLLPNRVPESRTGIKSADALGWYFRRWDELIAILREEGRLKDYFKKSELLWIFNKLEDSINRVVMTYTKNNLAINKSQETWMDSVFEGERDGARIEIQALRMEMYSFLYKVTGRKIYRDLRLRLIAKAREVFWTGEYLKDGAEDSTIRPNVFIAAYAWPDLLSREEWIKCFDYILPRLWLPWGGISTIDKNDRRFHAFNTGEEPASYHNGDSWYWINNMAALVLYRLDYSHFKEYVDKILEASCEDILFKGFIGCNSELSSAAEQKAQGCLNQAWSNAMFVELVEEMFLGR
jgi:glycogen debranching enzyme